MKQPKSINLIIKLTLSLMLLLLLSNISTFAAIDEKIENLLTAEETDWLLQHQSEILYVGLDPEAGMEYFSFNGRETGYLKSIVQMLSEKLDLNLQIRPDLSWSEAVSGLQSNEIQILFGANPTEERLKFMRFTDAIYSVPYTVLGKVSGEVQNIGDLNNRTVGFLEGDVAVSLFQEAYPNLTYQILNFDSQNFALDALDNGQIDGFITSGGDVVYDYLFKYPGLRVIANIEDLRSLMTFSTLIENQMLVSILSKSFGVLETEIREVIDHSRIDYVRKILSMSPFEEDWLKRNPSIKVGVPNDYLPIDYPWNGAYKGIAGHYLTEFANLIGLELVVVQGTFDALYEEIQEGNIDLLNMAITDERLENFVFTEPFSNERDLIYGLSNSPYVHDIYGLEGKRVAVINGFWHIDYLNLNLRNVELVITRDIKEAIETVKTGEADYFIETPAVAEFYISGLGYTNIIKKGATSSDSFLTFGLLPEHEPLVQIFNRARLLISYEEAKYLGVQGLPEIENVANRRLIAILLAISLFLIVLIIVLFKVLRDLWLTRERERLIYIDPLTGLYNRGYFNLLETTIDTSPFPQALFVLDINLLKDINDSYGHHLGDRLIDAVSSILSETALKSGGTAIRMGGDEFVLLNLGMPENQAIDLCSQLRTRFEATPLMDDDQVILNQLQVAIGVATRKDATLEFEELFKHADQQMYQNKADMKQKL